jgi:hypothetical protein
MKTANITIAGKSYTIKELPIRKSVEWRKMVANEWSELAASLTNAGATSLTDMSAVTAAVQKITEKLFGSVEIATNLLFAYAPELAADRDHIEMNGYESEIIDAFVEVIALAFPFSGKLRGLMREFGSPNQSI